MLVNVNVQLRTLSGIDMKDDDGQGNAVGATVKSVIVNAVLSPVEKELGIDKVKKYELAKKIYSSDEVNLDEDEIKLIKERIGECFSPLVVGQVFELLRV